MPAVTTRLERACRWIARLAALNLIWIVGTLLGGIVLGVMPATGAVFVVLRRWTSPAGADDRLLPAFWAAYRSRFAATNVFGYLLAVLGYLLAINLSVAWTAAGVVNIGAAVVFLTLTLAYILAAPHAFPAFVTGSDGVARSFVAAFARGLAHPLLTLLGALVCGTVLIVMVRWAPVLLPFFGVSGPALAMTVLARLVHNGGTPHAEDAAPARVPARPR